MRKHEAELAAIYAETDALLAPHECDASADCCTFSNTGREPYPTAIEVAVLERAIAARGGARAVGRRGGLPLADRRCPLLEPTGRCAVYAARPFGCRTFFCGRARGPARPRGRLRELGARIADLSARAFPRDPGPRPLSRALAR